MSRLGQKIERQLDDHIRTALKEAAKRGDSLSRGEIERAIPDALRKDCGAILRAPDGTSTGTPSTFERD